MKLIFLLIKPVALLFLFLNMARAAFAINIEDIYLDPIQTGYFFSILGFRNDGTSNFEEFDALIEANPSSILFLGDYHAFEDHSSAVQCYLKIKSNCPSERINLYQTDILLEDNNSIDKDNFYTRKVNHVSDAPLGIFEDDQHTLILGKKIICLCNSILNNKTPNLTCGGIDVSKIDQMKNFILDIARTLDKKNNQSLAVVHGGIYLNRCGETLKDKIENNFFQSINYSIEEVKKLYPYLKYARKAFSASTGNFLGIVIGNNEIFL